MQIRLPEGFREDHAKERGWRSLGGARRYRQEGMQQGLSRTLALNEENRCFKQTITCVNL